MAAPSDRPAPPNPEAGDVDLHGTIYSESVPGGEADPVTLASRLVNLRFHARGGLGEVFRAHDSTLNRQVAVKFIAPAQIDEEASRNRFLLEGEITGRLDHPGVVPVYGLGETGEGRPFLAMRFIEGVTLRSAIDAYHAAAHRSDAERRRDLNRLLTHLVAACNAVAYAHSRGIVHRDIKPDNIMIGKFNETFVVDWGLALPIDRDASSRASGEESIRLASVDASSTTNHGLAGTVGYIGPEALSGTATTGPESDVYSLGGTLYYLLTGRRAVSGGATAEVLDAIRRGAFPPPRALRPDVTRPLDAVCRKAMAVAPQDRHPSALALAADIEACIADEPVSALREGPLERALRWSRRHRLLVGGGVLGLLTITLLSSIAGVWLAREARQQQEARFAADHAKRHSLELAASFAAQTVAGEIDVRWRILEAMADDETLRRTLQETAATGADPAQPLQKWLSARQQEYLDIGADSWFVLGADGRQLARHPFQPQTIGKAFAGRDYFHGRDREYDSPPDDVKPLRKPHVSVAYVSSSDHSLKIAYSVPIWAPDDEGRLGDPVGVLAMTAKAGEFRVLKRGIGTDQVGVLIDLRPTDTADGARGGVVLHHPDLTGRQVRRIAAEGTAGKDFIAADDVTRLARLRQARIVSLDAATRPLDADPGNYTADYVDPLQPNAAHRWSAAFEPVIVEGRPAEQGETFLVVLVQQREE